MAKSTLSNKTKSQAFDWPTTTEDHENMEKWVYGDELLGAFAKSNAGWKRYREDIERAYGNEDSYYNGGILYVDTFKPVAEQLKKLKK